MADFDADTDNDTHAPGVVSREANARMLEVTGTQPTNQNIDKQANLVKQAFMQIIDNDDNRSRKKWTHTEVSRLATQDQWSYGLRFGHIDVGTICAVGNLLLRGMSVTATRKALGITPYTWQTWYTRGIGEDVGIRPAGVAGAVSVPDNSAQPQAPYNVFAFIVDHSQAIMELRATDGWTGHFERDWRAAQAFLVARNPEDWNPVNKTAIDTVVKAEVSVDRQDTNDLLEVLAILERAGALPSRTTKVEVLQVESVEVPDTGDRSETPDLAVPEPEDCDR